MRFLKLSFSLIFLFLSPRSFGQIVPAVNCSLTTSYSTCLNQSVLATVVFTASNYTTNFVWTVSPGAVTVSLNSLNYQVGITYTNCGVHTLSVVGYNSVAITCTSNLVVNVLCNSGSLTPIMVSPTNASVCAGFSTTLTATGAVSYTWYPGIITQPTLTAAPGIYTVVGTNTMGCTTQQTVAVILKPPLEISLTQSSPTTCIVSNSPVFSKSVTLNAGGAATYTWFPNNSNPPGPINVVNPVSVSCYTVVGSNATCSGSAVTCVTVIPQFSIGVSTNSLVMCKGDTHTLGINSVGSPTTGPSSAFTYTWTEAPNAPPISISNYFTPTVAVFPKNTTTYTVEMRDGSNCSSLRQYITVTVKPCTGFGKELDRVANFRVFPNPAHGKFYIFSKSQANLTIELEDMLGHVYLKQRKFFAAEEKASFNVGDLPSGIYLLKLTEDGEIPQIMRVLIE